MTRGRDEHAAEAQSLRESGAEMLETNKVLKINIDKLSRAQQERGGATDAGGGAGDEDRAKYAAIGESDRMTLRFKKP